MKHRMHAIILSCYFLNIFLLIFYFKLLEHECSGSASPMLSSEDASVASKFVNRILNLNSRSASSGMYVVSSIILVIIIIFFGHDSIRSVL